MEKLILSCIFLIIYEKKEEVDKELVLNIQVLIEMFNERVSKKN